MSPTESMFAQLQGWNPFVWAPKLWGWGGCLNFPNYLHFGRSHTEHVPVRWAHVLRWAHATTLMYSASLEIDIRRSDGRDTVRFCQDFALGVEQVTTKCPGWKWVQIWDRLMKRVYSRAPKLRWTSWELKRDKSRRNFFHPVFNTRFFGIPRKGSLGSKNVPDIDNSTQYYTIYYSHYIHVITCHYLNYKKKCSYISLIWTVHGHLPGKQLQ